MLFTADKVHTHQQFFIVKEISTMAIQYLTRFQIHFYDKNET
jgi:hypothetical protein